MKSEYVLAGLILMVTAVVLLSGCTSGPAATPTPMPNVTRNMTDMGSVSPGAMDVSMNATPVASPMQGIIGNATPMPGIIGNATPMPGIIGNATPLPGMSGNATPIPGIIGNATPMPMPGGNNTTAMAPQ